jgi:hypothetical protein
VKRRHGFLIAVILGSTAVAGTFAALQTTNLGPAAAEPSEREIARADKRLDRQEAQVSRASKRRPPQLSDAAATASTAPAAAPAPPAASASSGHGSGDGDGWGDEHAGDDDYEDMAEDREDAAEDRDDAMEDAFDD